MTKNALVVTAALALLPLAVHAQKPTTQTESVEVTATIEAIDHTARSVTLKGPEGNLTTIFAPPEVKRFNELKVGDKVTFKYYESVAYSIRKPGENASVVKDTAALTRGTGAKPSATIAQQQSGTVTVKAVDPKAPSITVQTSDGRTVSLKVDDPKKLAGVKAGDKVDITYTEAVMISVK